jgi:hypothetical protein
MKFDIWARFENLSIMQVYLKSDKGALHEEQYKFCSLLVLPRIKKVSDKSCREDRNTYIIFSNFIFENHAIFEVMWVNIVERGKLQIAIWRIRIA